MADTHQYLVYQINIKDLPTIQALQNTLHVPDADTTVVGSGIGAILAAPDVAAVKYSAPKLAPHVPFVAPSITSAWFGTEDHFPTDVASFDRKSGGWFGWPALFGDTTHYHWRGVFNYSPSTLAVAGAPPTFAPRRWIDGFELPDLGEGGTGAGACSRGASRHVQGMGFACHHLTGGGRSHQTNENGAALPTASWERFYVRLRTTPAAAATLWLVGTNVSPAIGLALQLLPSGQLAVNQVDAAGNFTLMGTIATALVPDVWTRVDLLYACAQAGLGSPKETFKCWINGTVVFSFTDLTTGMQTNGATRFVLSTLGAASGTTMAVDLDDWINADYQNTDGIDFQNGSAIRLVSPTGLDGATANWAGDYRALLQNPADTAIASMTSSTAAAPLVVTTDATDVIEAEVQSIGLVAMAVIVKATTLIATTTLGLIGGGGELTGTLVGNIAQVGSNWMRFLYRPTPTTAALKPVLPIKLALTHGGAGLSTVKALFAVVELLGVFGPEDAPHVTPAPTVPVHLGIHNAPYPNTPWATLTTPPIQPVYIRAGTYVGNASGVDLHFPVPIHFFWVRPLTGDTGGSKWWPSLLGAHRGLEQQPIAAAMVHAGIDPGFIPAGLDLQQQQTTLQITGADTQSNANAVTYAYLAIGDPGMRFLLAGVLKKWKGTVDVITTLAHSGFQALAGFFWQENLTGAAASGLSYKGPGHAAQSISPLDSAEVASALQFGPAVGQVTSRAAIMPAGLTDLAFLLFRSDDGSGHGGAVVQLRSYVGDGNATRTISFSPITGKRPLWALVVPHNATGAVLRDPSHTGTTSTNAASGAAIAATGISGGDIDSLTVGITLNANGIGYDVFVVPGDTVAGNNGFSIAGEFIPVPPEPPPGAPTDADSLGSAEPPDAPIADPAAPGAPAVPISDPLAPTGPMPGLTDDLAAACTSDTHRLLNLALSRIGVSKQIVNVATDVTREAVAARLVYVEAIQTTLRDFPWPFATRYVQLAVLNGGARPNTDWRYVYRQPSDCLFERRLVVSRTDVANPESLPFQLSSDFDPGDALAIPPVAASGGGLIFCNVANAILEYTARPKCPLTKSEPLFRDAAAWKLAEMMGPSLSKIADSAVLCAKAYQGAIDQAYLVLRPGNAGDVPATATIDTSAAAIAANLAVANTALIQIGAKTIRNLTSDQSREAQLVRIVFEQELRATLRDYPWPFATVYATPTLVGGTSSVPVNGDWTYSYRLPTDLVFARRLVTQKRRTYDPNPATYKLAKDATGGLLYSDTADAVLEYTNRPEGAVLVSDPLFRDALAWRLSWKLAPSLALLVPDRPEAVGRGPDETAIQTKERTGTVTNLRARAAETARTCYYFALATAKVSAAREAQPDVDPIDASWISDRD